ncbi:DUF3237 domain-containing protein [Sphingosinicella soli]|uniref:UPF0311 protein GGQ98_002221 n=1 Tax=Sphingosinicella soli TaxID=333708 RepID=A0A7W7B3X6_9SPHN|nr:DUF3237 domain-containing protein [Sphingosinicella soli]MBB4632595.1 hypothetical protein [Sphingosinicella soli]
MSLSSRPLCRVSITLEAGAPIVIGASPWRNRRVSHITGGSIDGERLRGRVEPGGGDWSELGMTPEGDGLTLLDVRSLWKTYDDALVYVTYQGRLTIPAAVLPAFRDPEALRALDRAQYYFRITPLFETADPRYSWLNGLVAVGIGTRTPHGVDYDVHELL